MTTTTDICTCEACEERIKRALAATDVVRRLYEGWEWPLTERADEHRYWTRPHTARNDRSFEVVTPEERAVIERIEANDG